MKTMAKKLFIATALLLVAACAKERPVEAVKDPEREKLYKNAFTNKVWNSKVTVVKTSTNGGFAFIGSQSENRLGYFDFTKDQLRFYDAVSLYEPKGAALPELINSWEITHHDVKLDENDGNVTSKEEEDPDKTWDQKRFFKVKFEKAEISENATFPGVYWAAFSDCWEQKSSRLVDGSLKTEPDHLTFTLAVDYEQLAICAGSKRSAQGDFTYTVHYKYSFWKREPSPTYKPYAYKNDADPEMKRFGFFQTVVEQMDQRTGLPVNTVLKNRWNPNREFIDFYFAPGTKDEYKWYFADPKVGVMARTNQLFEKNGIKTRLRIWNNDDGPGTEKGKVKEFGDGRYSFINIIDEIDPAAPLGYGPSDADPLTGEIVAANTMIWTGYLRWYLKRIGDQMDRLPTQAEKSTLYAQMKKLLKQDDVTKWTNAWDLRQGVGKTYQELLPEITYGYPGWARFSSKTVNGQIDGSGRKRDIYQLATELATNDFPVGSLEIVNKWVPETRRPEMSKALTRARAGMVQALANERMNGLNRRTFHTYPVDPVLIQGRNMMLDGEASQKVVNSILHRVSIHEFGHNLGLRHNFYGSVDEANHGHFKNHEPVAHGTEGAVVSHTSSVMDYMDLEHEMDVPYNWEPYDMAALAFTYSDGRVDDKRNYLFCTDEHTILNALCNRFDVGSTPSQIAMSVIKTYDDGYWTRNLRYDRQYWNSSGYDSAVFETMYTMKKFLPLWRRALDENTIRQELEKKGTLSAEEISEAVKEIEKDAKQAVKLSVAFYDAVIQQKASDRHYMDEYELFNGELKRLGIISDKIYAMLLFMGNDAIPYHPNKQMSTTSYMTYKGSPELNDLLEKIYENQLTTRVDMEPWFINFSRVLYGVTSTDPMNIDDVGNVDRIKVIRIENKSDLKKLLGIDMSESRTTDVVTLEKSSVPGFRAGETVGFSEINDKIYVVSQVRNPYAFGIIRSIIEADKFDSSTVQAKADLLELYHLYLLSRADSR